MTDARAGHRCAADWHPWVERSAAGRPEAVGEPSLQGSVAVSRSAMVAGPETSDVTNDQGPERRCEQGAQTAALLAGHNADMRTLVRRLSVESASSGRNDV